MGPQEPQLPCGLRCQLQYPIDANHLRAGVCACQATDGGGEGGGAGGGGALRERSPGVADLPGRAQGALLACCSAPAACRVVPPGCSYSMTPG